MKSTSVPPLNTPLSSVPESQLLDVGVAVFDPNIEQIDEELPIYPEVRRAEARYMADQLSGTLLESGAWGAVRVVPDTNQFTDLLVEGTILQSDGEKIALAVEVTDATGQRWIDKTYEGVTSKYAYERGTRSSQDPFLMVYREIANDMLLVFQSLSARQRREVRTVAELRFARNFAEDAFADYLTTDKNGNFKITRLPAEDDPMLDRVRNIRNRQYIFVDTLQGYYDGFSADMQTPYQEWRKLSYEEIVALRELQNESTAQLIAGGAALIAGIAAQGSSNSAARSAGFIGMMGGGYLLKSGLEKRAEANIHSLALEEIGQSLQAEITPRVIELEDRTVRLTGNVEDQYAQWREIMADIYAAEIGALDPRTPDSSSSSD
ncbi:hypothetical protein [Luminiphilus syltensis]|uniref:hypothetical protein n=1 Tax=Luminiphilus syltensis TaxID=1341119 RepID=UPI001E292FD0|nr:hypothetical protein [Luminiphilus syltensis]